MRLPKGSKGPPGTEGTSKLTNLERDEELDATMSRRTVVKICLGAGGAIVAGALIATDSLQSSPQDQSDEDNEDEAFLDPGKNIGRLHQVKLPQAGPYEVAPALRITYGQFADTQFGNLFVPQGITEPMPVIVMIHGGGWQLKTSLKYFNALSVDLASTGAVVWNLEYRRVGNGGGWPNTGIDIANAIDFLPEIAQTQGINMDLNRVFLAGHSSGGQLAAWAAARSRFPLWVPGSRPQVTPAGLITLAGVFDLKRAFTNGRDRYVRAFMGGSPSEVLDRYELASPMNYLPLGVPFISLHGDDDRVVSITQSIDFVSRARSLGDDARMLLLPGDGHTQMCKTNSITWGTAREAILNMIPGVKFTGKTPTG